MSKEKQIEETATEIYKILMLEADCSLSGEDCSIIAELLAGKDYRKQSEWISVEESLPEKYEEVLIFVDSCISTDFRGSNGVWYDHYPKEVTHWMPLPEAPKMKGGTE